MASVTVTTVTQVGQTVTASGSAPANGEVKIKAGTVVKGTTTANATGGWTISFMVAAGDGAYKAYAGGRDESVTLPAPANPGGGNGKGDTA